MSALWTLVANEREARVFETRLSREDFREAKRLGALDAADPDPGLARAALARSACRFVEAAAAQGHLSRLRIVAPARMLRLLRDELSDAAHALVCDEIPQDALALPPKEIQALVAGYGRPLG